MNILHKCFALVAIGLASVAHIQGATETKLLSNNMKGGSHNADFSEWPGSLTTEMEVEWVTEGEYASDKESIETGAGGVLFDGNTGSNWKSISYSKWSGGRWVTLNLTFEREYLIKGVDVWAVHEKTRDTEYVEILFSEDGKNFIPHQRELMPDVPYKKGNFVKIPLRLEEPVLAQYVQLRIARKKSARQQQIADIGIWGSLPEEGKKYLQASERPPVEFSIETIQAGVVNIDWSEFKKLNPDVKAWTIYRSPEPIESLEDPKVSLIKKVDAKKGRTTIYPLTAGETYYFAVSAVYGEGENPKVESIECTMPEPLAYNSFSDMVAINHFWGGGGNRMVDPDLLAETGITHSRWWLTDKPIVERFYEKGIGLYTYPYAKNMDNGVALGVHVFSGPGNEPDLKTTPIEKYVENLKKVHAKKERLSPEAVICAPSSGLEDHSIEWLDTMYSLGTKEYFEVLDLHTYTKVAGGHLQPDGYPIGAPEAMFDNMRKVREVMAKYDDLDKPIISTEFGYSESPVNNPSGKITPTIKAEYLVRGLVIHNVLGFKRVFLYSFFDEGRDINFTEHNFGLIDYDLQKKPAFYAVETLMNTLGDAVYESPVEGVELPAFAYEYRHLDSERNTVIMWDGTQNKIATFQTSAPEVTLTRMLGEQLTLIPNKDGMISVPYGPSPVYLTTTSDLTFVGSAEAQASATGDDWKFRPATDTWIVGADQSELQLPFEILGEVGSEETVRVIISEKEAGNLLDQEITVSPQDENWTVSLPLDSLQSALQELKIQVVQQTNGLSISNEYPFFVRQLIDDSSADNNLLVTFPGVEAPVHVLRSDELTVTIDAARGGRVLEIIDNESLTNQIRLEYAMLPDLPSLPFAFGIWMKLNGQLKDSPQEVLKATENELVLKGTVGDLVLTRTWTLNGSALQLDLDVVNKGSSTQKLRIDIHPEYQIGGLGESVTDVLYFPLGDRVKRLPFWSGLGEKKCQELTQNWWAALDTSTGLGLEQTLTPKDWMPPRIWFSMGCYNIELRTRHGLQLDAGKQWSTSLSWILERGLEESTFTSRL